MNGFANITIRFLLAVAFCLVGLSAAPADECRPPVSRHECPCCCPVPDPACCTAAVPREPAPIAPANTSQPPQSLRDAIAPHAPLVLILPSADALFFSSPQRPARCFATAQALRSLLCVRTV